MSRSRRAVVLASFSLVASGLVAVAPVRAADVQLVVNPSVETVSAKSTALPASWTQVRLGKQRATFGYPTSGGAAGARYVTVSVSSWTSGSVFWRFAPVAVREGQTYTWADQYRSTVTSTVVAELRTAGGTVTYQTLGTVPAAASWATATFALTIPTGVTSISVGHRLDRVGRLDVDDSTVVGPGTAVPPATPAAPMVCATATGQLSVSWSAVTGATGYDVSVTPVGGATSVLSAGGATSRLLTGLAAGDHDIRVRAIGSGGVSTWSDPVRSTVVPTLSTSLVVNGSLEIASSDCAAPVSWIKGRWGTNTASFTYPSTGARSGSRFVRVEMTTRTDGDAKWAFDHAVVSSDIAYEYSDWYRSNTSSDLVAEFRSSSGAMSYRWLRTLPAASTWTNVSVTLAPPAGTVSMTVFHLLASVGRLDLDDVSLVATTPPPPPPPIPGLPDRFVAGYLEGWNLALPSTLPVQYEILYHAFATIGSDGTAAMYLNGVSRSQLASEYKSRRAAGLPTLLSIGGAGGAMSGLGTAAHQERFLATLRPLLDEFGFSGIDWDLEQGVPGGISPSGLASVSRALRATYGPQFLITMAPYGAAEVEGPMKIVARDLQSTGDLAYVGFQFYNDNAPTSSSVLAEMRSWLVECGLRPDQFVLGFWAGPWDWPAGYVMQESTMASIYRDVRAAYPTLRGTYTWGIQGTDRVRNWAYATTMGPVVHQV